MNITIRILIGMYWAIAIVAMICTLPLVAVVGLVFDED